MDMQDRILKAAQEVLAQLQAQVAQHVAAHSVAQGAHSGMLQPISQALPQATQSVVTQTTTPAHADAANSLPVVQVLGSRSQGLAARLAQVLGAGYQWVFQGEAHTENTVQRYVLPTLSCSSLAALATGQAPTPQDEAVLALLLRGKVVEVLEFEHHSFRATAPAALYGLYTAHEAAVAEFGLCPARTPAPEEILHTDRLVTEADVTKAHASGTTTLAVLKQAIVTPLAADAAAQRGITIVKRL
ncbi:hypothetical protein [Desulfovibrio cuneatus]|uniref:hypothetical protein n=1 Tax=Desulfovibrio cuneatus TaxID=159728 RepID=UPI0003F9365E|nr:hypothetical protein [Desulfovibrio cuneatus]